MNDPHFSPRVHDLATASVTLAIACALLIALHLFFRPQRMWIMNVVWPLTALFGSVLWLAAYWRWGRNRGGQEPKLTFPIQVLKGASHCGAGCTLGDLVGEGVTILLPGVLVLLGWHSVFQKRTFAAWIFDSVLAFGFGILFQYFTIAPMRHLSPADGMKAAVKADVLSIASWQIGMCGVMAALQFGSVRPHLGSTAPPTTVEFWAMMQLAMLGGFLTSYPMNWILLRKGFKERM